MNDRRHQVLVAVQQALLGEVSLRLRAVTVSYDATSIRLDCYHDGEITDEDREAMSCVETELMAVSPENHTITHKMNRKDYPGSIPKETTWAFFRKENHEKIHCSLAAKMGGNWSNAVANKKEYIECLQLAVEHLQKCSARHGKTLPVHESFQGHGVGRGR